MSKTKTKWSGKSRGGAFGHQFFISLVNFFGVKVAYGFLAFIVIYFIPCAPKASKALWKYNRQILGYGTLKAALKIYQHYYTFGKTLIDKIALKTKAAKDYRFEYENYEAFLEQLNNGACIMIGAHVGSWESGADFFGEYAQKLNVVMFDAEYQRIKEAMQAQAGKHHHKVIPINEGGIESLIKIKYALDEGEYVCFQGDRYYEKSNATEVTFMGKKALFPLGPSLLAAKFKVPVVFYFAMRQPKQGYKFIFKVLPKGLSQKEIMDRYLVELENIVREYPQQWFNFYDLWESK